VASCKQVGDFLGQLGAKAVTTALPDPAIDRLGELGLVALCTPEQFASVRQQLASLDAQQQALAEEQYARLQADRELRQDVARDHSVLFHLHGKDRQAADRQQEAAARAREQAIDADLTAKEQAFNDLVARRAMLDTMTPVGARYVGLTPAGAAAARDLAVRMYRFADADFDAYAAQLAQIDRELLGLAASGASYFAGLSTGIPEADRAYLWAISVGLAKSQSDPQVGGPRFLSAYGATAPLSHNTENRLMASEILTSLPGPVTEAMPLLGQLVHDVHRAGVPHESALGVGAIVLFGRRADGSFATENVAGFLRLTRSFESAALLGIVNQPAEALAGRFQAFRGMFTSWGYAPSEDTELASAYLAVAELAPGEVDAKLAILTRGLLAYLQYPLVAGAILASIPTLEANETLNVVEKAYGVVGRQAVGLSQTELICVAIRMVHGLRNELVGTLDATATAAAGAATTPRPFVPRPMFLPVVIAHGAYYSTFSGVGGVHPGHVHGLPGGFGGAGVG